MENTTLEKQLRQIVDEKTKPPGSLGRLEEIAIQVGLIQHSLQPSIVNPQVVVFAADHGVTVSGLVNPYPQQVTAQMVLNFISGGAAINVFCRQHNIGLKIIDAGVNDDFDHIIHPCFIDAKIKRGTCDYRSGLAMEEEDVRSALLKGKEIVKQITAETGTNCIGFGEMGIGNTSSASLIMSAVTGIPIRHCVGKGTGTDKKQLQTKMNTLCEVYSFHELQYCRYSPIQLLSKIGGFEIAMMVGAYLQAVKEKMVVVVDGFISTAAVLLARQLNPDVLAYCIFGHTSGEKGHARMLDFLKSKPLLNLGLRLGEGTGAALAISLIQSSVNFLNEMASFEAAGVTNK